MSKIKKNSSKESSADAEERDGEEDLAPADLKIILLGDSAVGKSKLLERFLMDDFVPRQLSTYALTLYRYSTKLPCDKEVVIDFWDTAGQERFAKMHPSYYYQAHACVLVFDVTRKETYKHLNDWYKELRSFCPHIPVLCIANKIDVKEEVTTKKFKFPQKHEMPFYFASAASGTNVVRMFQNAIELGWDYKENSEDDWVKDVMDMLGEESGGGSVAPSHSK